MLKSTPFILLLRYVTKAVLLLLTFFHAIPPALAILPSKATPFLSAVDQALYELLKAGWHKDTAEAVVSVNKSWFTFLKDKHENNFHLQVNLLKRLEYSVLVDRFLRKHPETAGLLAFSDEPITLVKTLDKPTCYNALTSFYALHTTPINVQLLTEALTRHRELLCQLAKRGILGSEMLFIFSRQTKAAKEYDAWLEEVFSKYLQHSDEQLANIIIFLMETGQSIRQRLEKDQNFYKQFRKKLWPALIRVVDNNGAFELLANEPYIWDLLSVKEGEVLLNKWGLGPIDLLFGKNSYPVDMQSIIIHILLQGDDNTVDALFRYRHEPLFHDLMRRSLPNSVQAALVNKLAGFCPFYPEQPCPDLPHHLRYFASITDNTALAEEVGPPPNGPVTWIPFHGSYYAIKKMTQGREITGEDMLNMGLDALAFVPAALLAYPFAQTAQPLTKEIILNVGIVGLAFTPRTYHVVKPLGKFAIRAGSRTSRVLTQQLAKKMTQQVVFQQGKKITTTPVVAFIKKNQQLHGYLKQYTKPIAFDITKPLLLINEKVGAWEGHITKLIEFETRVFMRNDSKIVMDPADGLGRHFFKATVEKALLAQFQGDGKQASAWQQNISAWWLMNATVN